MGDLKDDVEKQHGKPIRLIGSKPVHVQQDGTTKWKGEVEAYALEGHDRASHCFAAAAKIGGEKVRTFTVLGIGPVANAEDAIALRRAEDGRGDDA